MAAVHEANLGCHGITTGACSSTRCMEDTSLQEDAKVHVVSLHVVGLVAAVFDKEWYRNRNRNCRALAAAHTCRAFQVC